MNVLRQAAKFNELTEEDSRTLTLEWISHEDQMQLEASDSKLSKRYVLALLAYEFGISSISSTAAASTNWLSNDDECNWDGALCSAEGIVRKVELAEDQYGKFSLTGALRPEISKLRSLEVGAWKFLHRNKFASLG